MNICFLLPSNSISGGIFTVFKHASALSRKGHKITIGFILKDSLVENSNFQDMEGIEFKSVEDLFNDKSFDIVVATWWETIFLLPSIHARHYLYFVQGFEDEFYSADSLAASLVFETYKENLHYATISNALSERLSTQFQKQAEKIPCGINLSMFQNAEAAIPRRGKLRAMVEGLPNDERKQVSFTLDILSQFEELEVIYVSPHGKPAYNAKIDYFFQSVPHEQMPSIYKSCDFLVKLSTTESFALPVLEIFAAGGTAVISAFKGHDEYIENRENALVVPAKDKDASYNAISEIITNSRLRTKLQERARETAQNFPLSKSTEALESLIEQINAQCSGCGNPDRIKSAISKYKNFKEALIKF